MNTQKFGKFNMIIFILLCVFGAIRLFLYLNEQGILSLPQNLLLGSRIVVVIVLSLLVSSLFIRLTINKIFNMFGEELEIEQKYFVTKIYSLLVYVLAVAFILHEAGVSLDNLTIFLGLATTGLAFALRDIFVSFLAWLMISAKKLFRIGDVIQIDEVQGKVDSITTSFVTLSTLDASSIKIPNKLFIEKPMKNYGKDRIVERIVLKIRRWPKDMEKETKKIHDMAESCGGLHVRCGLEHNDGKSQFHLSYQVKYGQRIETKNNILRLLSKSQFLEI